MNDWISTRDCLPEPHEDVIVAMSTGLIQPTVDIGYRRGDGGWLLTAIDDIPIHVTHWQPLPALPIQTEAA